MDVVLSVVDGPRAGLRFRAKGKTWITMGRSKTTDFHVLDTTMSRVHAVVAKDDQGWFVQDQKSRHGVWIRGERVDRARLEEGTIFHLGRATGVRFHLVPNDHPEPNEVAVTLACARCERPISADDIARGADGRPYHMGCRNLDHLVGTDLGEFRIVEPVPPLGEAFSFRAHQPTLNRTVVLEVFDLALTSRPGFRDALLAEVRRASRLLHPNVLQIYDFGEARGMCFVVMEHFRGTSLASVLEERRFVKIRGALAVATQVLEALDYAREQGSVLPWIGTGPIIVSEEHEVKVKLFREPTVAPKRAVTAADAAYLAPEVLSGTSKGQEPTSVVYSVGAILYHMLAGIRPFEGDSTGEIARRALAESPPALRRINLKVSPALARVVETALERDPTARHASVAEFLTALRRAAGPTAPAR